ncbi:hypothetical protein NW768_006800 [Fusarium equiseti]|uniref:U1-type domain-containing protein n=1 Tax=Fusarium equiseti TaxID=61235 RepID=A0ABQ8R973_FUSEQ|nr:hypothetical protein NW768_006800 [Fusarium equiseti]
MSEYWKSTPKYWCKHCQIYVRDTKLERTNHESTAKHQGALKRFLRDLHRGHEREEREKERAKQEIARLNGVVSGSSSSAAGPSRPAPRVQQQPSAPTEASLKKQREQLAEMGVAMPSDFRPEMAMPGEWTVTNTRVIEKTEEDGEVKVEKRANGVRKREATEEEKEEENAMQSLFKKPRRWGRDSKAMPQEDHELDALLSGSTFAPRAVKEEAVKKEEDDTTDVKKEEDDDTTALVKEEETTTVKTEAPDEPLIKPEPEEAEPGVQAVVFKKRKPKGIRQK